MIGILTLERHNQLLKSNTLYPNIWNQFQIIEDFIQPFILLDDLYPEFYFFEMIGIEQENNHKRTNFYGQVIAHLSNLETIVSGKLIEFHDDSLNLNDEDAKKLILKLRRIINKYKPIITDITFKEKTTFNKRILPIAEAVFSKKDMPGLYWQLTLVEFRYAAILNTQKYYENIITSLEERLELTNTDKGLKESRRPKSNISQIVLAICAVITVCFTIIFGVIKALNEPNKKDSLSKENTVITNTSNFSNPANLVFNTNPPIKELYSDILNDFDVGTNMQYVRDKLGSPKMITTDNIMLFEDIIELDLERYTYDFKNGIINFWSDTTKQNIEIVELTSNSKKLTFNIPVLSAVLDSIGYENTELGELKFNEINENGDFRIAYIIEGIINDHRRFDYYFGRFGGYQNYVFSNTDIERILYEKNDDFREISSDSIMILISDYKPNSIALY